MILEELLGASEVYLDGFEMVLIIIITYLGLMVLEVIQVFLEVALVVVGVVFNG